MTIIEAAGTVRPVTPLCEIKVKLLHSDAVVPSRAHASDAGLDLHCVEKFTLLPNERRLVDTGVAIAIPNNIVGMVCPRSGLAAKYGITVVNAPGIIDSGYTNAIKVILLNTSLAAVEFNIGDRIAQLVLSPVLPASLVAVDSLPEADRGLDGFGSTGR